MTSKPTYEELAQMIERLVKEVKVGKNVGGEREWLETQRHHMEKMESIGIFAGGIANDFNNLLMGIQGHISLMLLDIDSHHPHFEPLKEIEACVSRAEDLTNRLLSFSMTGKHEVKSVDLNDLVKKSVEEFGKKKERIVIHPEYGENIWAVEVDEEQIEQALTSFYTNAWQVMPDGGDLYIQTENVTLDEDYTKSFQVKSGAFVKVSVMDTGMGMDEDTRQKIFDPFFTAKGSSTDMGFQLTSAYGIIKNHGGIISIYSEKGKGTTFNIYLPVSRKQFIKLEEIIEEISIGSETILLVDDEEMILDIGRQLLESLGYEVLTAGNGKRAIETYKKEKNSIDMVLLDIIMPDMDGGETFDELRKIDPEIKVLLASGHSMDGRAATILKRGCDGFIQKPYNLKQLSRKIREVLKKTNS